jgi:KaiC/GvpD/RAD55 family RecA-like ATPase
MDLKRVTTGIEGLDKMLGGGLVQGRSYVLLGGPGSGKTILSMHFLMDGAKKGEEGLYIALEENSSELKENMSVFGWDLKRIKLIDTTQDLSGKWSMRIESVIGGPELTLNNILAVLKEYISKYNIKRVVVDSLTSFKLMQKTEVDYRRSILTLMKFLSTAGCTAVLTVENPDSNFKGSLMEEFLASGVIDVGFIEHTGEWLNSIRIKKMRGMAYDQHTRPMKITDKGVVIFSSETLY